MGWTHVDHVLALVTLLGMGASAFGLLGDMHMVDIPRRASQVNNLLGALFSANAVALKDVEALSGGSLVDIMEALRAGGTESTNSLLRSIATSLGRCS